MPAPEKPDYGECPFCTSRDLFPLGIPPAGRRFVIVCRNCRSRGPEGYSRARAAHLYQLRGGNTPPTDPNREE